MSTGTSGRRRTPIWALSGLTLLVLAAALTLAALNAGRIGPGRLVFEGVLAGAVLLYTGTGWLITGRVPANPIGWLLNLSGLLLATEILAEQYPLYGLVTAPGSLPAARVVGWFAILVAVVAVFVLLGLVLLFPDGRLPSRRWRTVWLGIAMAVAASVLGHLRAGVVVEGGVANLMAEAQASYPNPLGLFPRPGWLGDLPLVAFGLGITTGVLAVAAAFARRRAASPERRKQLAWLGYIGLLTALWLVLLLAADPVGIANGPAGAALWILLVVTPIVGIPVACTVAVLKYRLYDIDRIISRTLAYTIVTGLLVGVYAGLVLLGAAVPPLHGPVAVAGATLVAAALFSPLRRRVQHLVDRQFNRARYDADQTIGAFAARVREATDLGTAHDDLVGAVDRALEPAHISVWLARS